MLNLKSKHIIIVFLFCVSVILSQNRWEFVNPQPTGFDLYNVNKDSYQNIWVMGEFGTILKSDDNCESWKTIKINFTDNFYDSEIINEKMWIVGQNGLILFSPDLGSTWNKQISNTNKSLVKIKFIDEDHGWIMARDSLVLRTEDGGINWQRIRINNRWPQTDMTFLNKDVGYLLSGYYNEPNLDIKPWTVGAIFKTNDGGLTWAKVDSGSTKYSSIYFLNDRIGFMSVHNNQTGRILLKSTDSGNSWDTLSHTFVWNQMHFVDEQNGIAIGGYFLGKTTDGGLNWIINTEINTPSPSSKLTSIYTKDQSVIIVGTEGNILKSNDLGDNWNRINSSIDFYYAALRGVTFVNRNIGYIYGLQFLKNSNQKSILLSTLDGGKTWNNLPSPSPYAVSIFKKYDNILWASSNTKLYRSDNNGTSWIEIIDVAINRDEQIRDIFVFNSRNIVFLAGRRVYNSKDGGSSWSHTSEFYVQFLKQFVRVTDNKWIILGHLNPSEPNFITENSGLSWRQMNSNFTTMKFINENIGYAIDSTLYKTTNGGTSWEVINHSVKSIAYWTSQLFFYNESVGWLNNGSFLYYTRDGGYTWTKEYGINGIADFYNYSFSIISESNAWAVGSNGHIFRLTPDGVSSLNPSNHLIPQEIFLYQNYPNPFNPYTNIKFAIPHYGKVTLRVYDLLGREISVLLNDYLDAGIHEVIFNGNNLSSGIYFYKLTMNNYSVSKKLVLLK